ncbi:hypothetical protein A0J61_07173 [Choanephora cucurbitarum]|uniref:Tc1-like transposase DDE domain-containing protein n=1 Tax=Choanephora cucurbitarum TaxID=101091 RepID=A0A1C7N701_9FUNG|nr:hypothetical protein A0J61_07173 [Choanephora cucurbitarum]
MPNLKSVAEMSDLKFLEEALYFVDKHDRVRDFYLFMNNAPIHSSKQISELIESRIKHKILWDLKTLEERIIEAAYEIPLRQLRNIIKLSKH